jgi:NDP-sugar pyrophosphorylase family protein
MKIILLAGGIGKRMFPITEDKFLLNFCGKTLLEHHIDMAKRKGFDDILVIGNPLNIERIKSIAGKDAKFAVQNHPKGMADALMSAEKFISGEPFIVVSTNDVFDESAYENVLNIKDADSVILGCKVEKYFPGGYLSIDGGNIKAIVEKPGEGNEPSDIVNVVVHLHRRSKELFDHMRSAETDKDDHYEAAMDRMMKSGFKFKVARYSGFWKAIKYPWHILDITRHFLGKVKGKRISPYAKISDKAVVEGDVIIERGVKILENAVVKGPVYIGENSVIGNNALVRDNSHIGKNSVVGFSTEVKNSYVGDNCWFHSNYIGDSIISDNCSFGAGAVTANFRFDEKIIGETGLDKFGCIMGENCKAGINVSMMPGVKVGPNSIVGPHVMVHEDVGHEKLVLLKQEHRITKNKVKFRNSSKLELMKKLTESK